MSQQFRTTIEAGIGEVVIDNPPVNALNSKAGARSAGDRQAERR